jgi:antitoxin SocA-like protein
VNFPVNAAKATEAYGRLLEKENGRADHLRLAKLIYLADRRSILERGVPIVGGTYFSLRKGPMISETTDFAKNQNAPGWKEHISPRYDNEIRLLKKLDPQYLSEAEIEILDAVVQEHNQKTTEELTQWCHDNCPEYENVLWTRKPITVERLLAAGKKPESVIARIVEQAKSDLELDAVLAGR